MMDRLFEKLLKFVLTVIDNLKRICKRKKKCILPYILVFSVTAILVDYGNERVIPNFFFLNSFSKNDVADYWAAVIKIVVIAISVLTFILTSDKFFFEKHVYNENQRRDIITKYQDFVRTAIKIFNENYDDEGECLFAVQIMQNILSLYNNGKFTKNTEEQFEPIQIISVEGVIFLLKRHLDRVWSKPSAKEEIRQDIAQVISILYENNSGLWRHEDLKRCGACSFKEVHINLDYFDDWKLMLKDMEFFDVNFDGKRNNLICYFEGFNSFVRCTFNCYFRTCLNDWGSISFDNCKLQGFKMEEIKANIGNREKMEGTKTIHFNQSLFDGYVWLDNNLFAAIKMESCRFKNTVYMRRIKVQSEMEICETEFLKGLNLEDSIFTWKMMIKKCEIYDMFYFWGATFYKKARMGFYETFFDDFQASNWTVEVYADKNQSDLKYCFEDLFRIEVDDEKKLMKLIEKPLKKC